MPKLLHPERINDNQITSFEVDQMLVDAEKVPKPDRFRCIICLAWIFGARIQEILKLKLKDVNIEGKYLYVSFIVGKKHTRTGVIDRRPYMKNIWLKNSFVKPILIYVQRRNREATKLFTEDKIPKISEEYLFPSKAKEKTVTIKVRFREENGHLIKDKLGGIERKYVYVLEGGHVPQETARKWLKMVNETAWFHLMRHSRATWMANHGASTAELLQFFSWTSPSTAYMYVSHGTPSKNRWSRIQR